MYVHGFSEGSGGMGSVMPGQTTRPVTPEEMARFTELNGTYKEKFGFPFILAVRNASKGVILGAFARRVHNTAAAELAECVAQVHKIAWMRLRGLVRISRHPIPLLLG